MMNASPQKALLTMARKVVDQQKISFLIGAGFFIIFVAMIGFGLAVVYNVVRLQASTQEIYGNYFSVSNAGLDTQAALSQLHSHMAEIILTSDPDKIEQQDKEMSVQDKNLRKNFSIVRAELSGDTAKDVEVERLLDDWQSIRMRMVGLASLGHRDEALKLAAERGAQLYSRLETGIAHAVALARHHAESQAEEAKGRASGIIHLVWWSLGGLAIFNLFSGVVVIRKVVTILEHDQQTSKKLYESEERLKLALSGADEGTWDLDILTGRLNFDSQWGEMLGYTSEKERPYYLDEWSALIHSEDRDRVLKAMHDHVAGWTSEYKAEYRIRSRSGGWKWFAGHGRAVHRDPEGKALRIVGVTRDITLKKQTEERIWRLAHSDSLTGLPNRPLFYERLSQAVAMAKRHDKKLALLFLDLDGFKQVNDQFGHDTGDELLQEVAERLRQHIRGEDIVARTGGDEFIFILNDISHAGNAAIVARKIIGSLAEPFVIHGNTCLIGGSIGISIYPDDSDEMEMLVTQSDNAMYKAKEHGKNNYQFFCSTAMKHAG